METWDLIRKYVKENCYCEVKEAGNRVSDFQLNGSILKIYYTSPTDTLFKGNRYYFDEKVEVDLLDYITWVFNQCKVD